MIPDPKQPRRKTLLEIIREGGIDGPKFATKAGVSFEDAFDDKEDIAKMVDGIAKSMEAEMTDRILRSCGTQGSTSAPPPPPRRTYYGGNRFNRNGVNCCEDCGEPSLRDLCFTCEGKRFDAARVVVPL